MTPDEKLNALLKQVGGLEPNPEFENAVWRRIHTASTVFVPAWWQSWLVPVAVAAGIMLGIGVGLIFPAKAGPRTAAPALVHQGSLTGAYMMLASGGDHE